MKLQEKKQEWIERALDSGEGITPTGSNPYLYQKVLLRLRAETREVISMRAVWMSAAAFFVLAFLNVEAMKLEVSKGSLQQDASIVASEYQLDSDPSGIFEN